ncbi:hypothetical protein BJP34_29210 [Moorena producens PAL-8-15-08-1]|uniref:SGNH hydrolase-type esterase domain-containing protein n=1 Tax=Moorena producens PAL-8-15-08-1 TaxID=1458985 RepID=A0A1D8TZB1_9CYAN|nr:hypothetical protein [Moorena producens]AOX02977.1 hypothetical protein BJP34_29210 [Moorena producens PAL-8-15-08-1]
MRQPEKFANIVLTCAITFCLAVLIHSTFLSPLSPEQLTKYYLVAVAGLLLFGFALLKWREETKVNFALALLSMGFALYVLEVLLFFGVAGGIRKPTEERIRLEGIKRAQQSGVPFDKRTKLQVLMDLRKEGIEAYPGFHAFFLRGTEGVDVGEDHIYPLGGVSNKLTILCNESGEWSVYQSDEHGFNNPPGIYENRALDMVLIGDSFTHGACVKPGEDIGGQLRQRNRQLLNLGNIGNGPLAELATLKEYGAPVRPRIVLWFYYEENDIEGLISEKKSSFLLQYLERDFSQGLLKRQPEIDQFLVNYIKKQEKSQASRNRLSYKFRSISRLYDLRRELKFIISKPSPREVSQSEASSLPLFRKILSEAKDQVNSWDGQLYFVYLPAWDRYGGTSKKDNLHYRNDVLSLVEELEIPIIDFHDVISTHPDPLSLFPFRMPAHYAAEGYRLLAEQIDTYLRLDSAE